MGYEEYEAIDLEQPEEEEQEPEQRHIPQTLDELFAGQDDEDLLTVAGAKQLAEATGARAGQVMFQEAVEMGEEMMRESTPDFDDVVQKVISRYGNNPVMLGAIIEGSKNVNGKVNPLKLAKRMYDFGKDKKAQDKLDYAIKRKSAKEVSDVGRNLKDVEDIPMDDRKNMSLDDMRRLSPEDQDRLWQDSLEKL